MSDASPSEVGQHEAKVLPARKALSLISPDPPDDRAGDESAGAETPSLDSLSEYLARSDRTSAET